MQTKSKKFQICIARMSYYEERQEYLTIQFNVSPISTKTYQHTSNHWWLLQCKANQKNQRAVNKVPN